MAGQLNFTLLLDRQQWELVVDNVGLPDFPDSRRGPRFAFDPAADLRRVSDERQPSRVHERRIGSQPKGSVWIDGQFVRHVRQ